MKKIIAVILTISFLAVSPAQADDQDRPAQVAGQDRSEKADRSDRSDREDREDGEDGEDGEDETTPAIGGGVLITSQSIGGGIPCCLAQV